MRNEKLWKTVVLSLCGKRSWTVGCDATVEPRYEGGWFQKFRATIALSGEQYNIVGYLECSMNSLRRRTCVA